jgi:hypothetical protein
MAKLFKLPRRTLQTFSSVKEVPSQLVKISEGRSKYWGKTNQGAFPTAVVVNSAVRLYYSPSEHYWENPSDLEIIPWLSGETKEIETSHGKIPLDQTVIFKAGRSKEAPIDLEYQARFLPKPEAVPLCFIGWASTGYYSRSPEIQPQSVVFAKEDCIAIDQSTVYDALQKISLYPPQGQAELKDSRFVLTSANNSSRGFAITGALSAKEWTAYGRRVIPGAPEPCTFDHVVTEKHGPGVIIPKKLYGTIRPEWFAEVKHKNGRTTTEFLISYDSALKLLPTHGEDLNTPARWVTQIKTGTSRHSVKLSSPTSVVVEMDKLVQSSIIVSEALWDSGAIRFDLGQISSWPRQALPAHIGEADGMICAEEPNPQDWKIVTKDHPNSKAFVYPHPGKRGFRKVHVLDLQHEQANQQKIQAVEAQLGKDFQNKYQKVLGGFRVENADQYLKAALYVRDHEVAVIPDYLGKTKRLFPDYSFCDAQEALRTLHKVKADTDYRGLQKTLVYFWFKVDDDNKREIEELLRESEPMLADFLCQYASKYENAITTT